MPPFLLNKEGKKRTEILEDVFEEAREEFIGDFALLENVVLFLVEVEEGVDHDGNVAGAGVASHYARKAIAPLFSVLLL